MKVRIYSNNDGRIVSIVEVKEEKGAPPTSIFSLPDLKEHLVKLTNEQAAMPLIALHMGHKLDLSQKEPRLISIAPQRRPKAGRRTKNSSK
jgi:hypothetical protein